MPAHLDKLDFELELAVVLNKQGRNVPASRADSYIAGYMIMNDMSARTLQMQEMKMNLGPAKGKEISNVLGHWLVTGRKSVVSGKAVSIIVVLGRIRKLQLNNN